MTDFPAKKPAADIAAILAVMLLILAAIAFSTPLLLRISGATELNSPVFFLNRLLFWLIVGVLWLYARYIARQPLLIWPDRKRGWAFYVLSVIVVLAILFAGMVAITMALAFCPRQATSAKFLAYLGVLRTNIPLLLFTAMTAGVVEELIFRGFIHTRLEGGFNSPVLAILLSSVLFALTHLSYDTVANVLGPFYIGIVFSIFYWRYRNIKVLMLCHFLWDVLVLFISIKRH